MGSERTESSTVLLGGDVVELHTTTELPNWSQRQGCSCGENFPSRADLWKHQADGRLASLKSLLGVNDPAKVEVTKTWTEDGDGVWHLCYFEGERLTMRSELCVELVTRYEGTEAAVEGWCLTDEPLTGVGFFGPLLTSLPWAKELAEVFEETLDRKRHPVSGDPAFESRVQSYMGHSQILREMVEAASGPEKEARLYNGDARECPACGSELAANTCQNLCCPVGIAFVATNYPDDLDEDLLPF